MPNLDTIRLVFARLAPRLATAESDTAICSFLGSGFFEKQSHSATPMEILATHVNTSALSSTTGVGESAVHINLSNGAASSADIHVSADPIPEPSTLLLLATGLLGAGLAFRRHAA